MEPFSFFSPQAIAAIISVIGALASALLAFYGVITKGKIDRSVEIHKNELSREMERLKHKIKNSEVLYNKQIEAATSLSAFYFGLLPHRDWNTELIDDAVAYMFKHIEEHIKSLKTFESEYSIYFTNDISEEIHNLYLNAISCLVEIKEDINPAWSNPGFTIEYPNKFLVKGMEFHKATEKLLKTIKDVIHQQVDTIK